MDDPWGSPWASATSNSAVKQEPTASPPRALLSLPPRAFFGSNTNSPTQSPWLDHADGDWTGPTQLEDAAASAPWGPWAEVGSTPRIESPGKQSPIIAWPSSAATSPGLKPTLRQRSSTLFRHASPDPWAVGSPWLDKDLAPTPSPTPPVEDRAEENGDTNLEVVINIEKPRASANSALGSEAQRTSDHAIHDSEAEFIVDDTGRGDSTLAEDRPAPGEVHDSPSRLSSTFSVESSPGPDRQDSPITSIDEDSAGGMRHSARTTSRKVSELVGLYDGLARAASEEAPLQEIRDRGAESRDRSRMVSLPTNGHLEAGGHPDEGAITTSDNPVLSETSKTPKTPAELNAFTAALPLENRLESDVVTENDDSQIDTAHHPSTAVRELTEKFGIIKFEPKLGLLESASGVSSSSNNGTDAQDNLPDRIITDSFNTVDERKAWYRISRFGSMGKHNSGDDENYHHKPWPDSQVHADTIKIVRRWMEEDSFSSTPILGGTKRTNAFNWDSSAAPVGLDKIFARRSLVTHPRPSSVTPLGHTPSSSIGSLSSVLEGRRSYQGLNSTLGSSGAVSMSPSPVPSFGWSSDALVTSSKAFGLKLNPSLSNLPTSRPVSLLTPELPPTPRLSTVVVSPSVNEPEDADGAEDDDWGEMVVSPSQDTFTTPDTMSTYDQGYRWPNAPVPPNPQAHPALWDGQDRPTHAAAPITAPVASGSQYPDQLDSGIPLSAALNISAALSSDSQPAIDGADLDALADTAMPQGGSASVPPSASPWPADKGLGVGIQPGKAMLAPIQPSNQRSESEIIQKILRGLPDLTYML